MTDNSLSSIETNSVRGAKYLRFKDLERIYGLKKGKIYSLLADGKIKSVLVRQDGKATGVRLFPVASIEEFFDTLEHE